MERSELVCAAIDEIHEELDPEVETLGPMGVAAVVRRAAEIAVDHADRERNLIERYLLTVYGTNPEVREAVHNIRLHHAHHIRQSGTVRAVRIQNGMTEDDVAALG